MKYLTVKPEMKATMNTRKCDVSLGTGTKGLKVESSGRTLRTTSVEVGELLHALS
jgi:hypothetical protein